MTHEVVISRLVRKIGPFIAIGKPNEKLPELGADRRYFENDQWRDEILNYIEKSCLIILRPSTNENVLWEFDQILKNGFEKKLIIVRQIGQDTSLRIQKAKYIQFAKRVKERSDIILPEYSLLKQYIYFDENRRSFAVGNIHNIPLYKELLILKRHIV